MKLDSVKHKGLFSPVKKARTVGVLVLVLGMLNGVSEVQDQVQLDFGTSAHLRPNDLVLELAQTFRPAVSGKLINFRHGGASPGGSTEHPTSFAITDVREGRPGTNRLGVCVVTNLTQQSYVAFENAEIYLDAETDYAIVISTEAPAGTSFNLISAIEVVFKAGLRQ